MFDQVVSRPRRSTLKSVLIVGSAVVHAAAVAGLVVAALWQVDRLPLGADPVDIAIKMPMPPMGAAALPAGKRQQILPPKVAQVAKTRVTDVVQPTKQPPEPAVATGAVGPTDGTLGGGGGGDGPLCRLPTDAPSDLPICATGPMPPCADPPCSEDGDPPPAKPPVVVHHDIVNVPPTVAKGLRLSGDEQVFPARMTQLAMVHDGKTQVRGTFQVCVDEGGSISSVRRLASTGYDDYDGALMDAMRGWRYKPYAVDGKAAPMCTVQVFVYRIKP